MRRELKAALALMPLMLQACVSAPGAPAPSSGTGTGAATATRPPVRLAIPRAPRDPQLHMMPGLEGVIGATESQLTGQFGPARLNVWEGDARKLQFTGSPCILDVYLYPTSQSREPIATYVEARRASDGKDVDRADCVGSLRRR